MSRSRIKSRIRWSSRSVSKSKTKYRSRTLVKDKVKVSVKAVSYTHLTLPTKRIV